MRGFFVDKATFSVINRHPDEYILLYLEVEKLNRIKKKPKRPIIKNAMKKRAKARESSAPRKSRPPLSHIRARSRAVLDKGDKFVKMTLIQGGVCLAILLLGLFIKGSSWQPAVNLKML